MKTFRPEKEEDHMKTKKRFNQTIGTMVTAVRERIFLPGELV